MQKCNVHFWERIFQRFFLQAKCQLYKLSRTTTTRITNSFIAKHNKIKESVSAVIEARLNKINKVKEELIKRGLFPLVR